MTSRPVDSQNLPFRNGCHRIAWLLLSIFFAVLFFQIDSQAQVRETRRILIFNELGLWSPGVNAVDQEIYATLEKSPYQIEFYTEDLDTSLFPDEARQQQFHE